jgi:hypothetical protein
MIATRTSIGNLHEEGVLMKYVMVIYQGHALERQAALPEQEQKQVYAREVLARRYQAS